MRVSLIVAVAENGIIGRGGTLPWHLSADLKRFKQLTMGHTIVIGRRTWESIKRSLPGRRIIVVSRRPGYSVGVEWVRVVTSLDEALEAAAHDGEDELFLIGGAAIYQDGLPRADRLYLTRVHANPEGDTRFPEYDASQWRFVESAHHDADANNDYPSTFQVYERT